MRGEALQELARKAKAAYDALSPEEKAAHDREQRIGWALGQMRFKYPDLTREQVEEWLGE